MQKVKVAVGVGSAAAASVMQASVMPLQSKLPH